MIFYLGMIRILFLFFHALSVFYRIFLSPKIDILHRYGKNSFVFITGAANGIGKEYAKHFANTGFNLILIDKDKKGLKTTKEELENLNIS
mmetsp:Transcript_6645/g.5753  ORF Transcript_6645/g.5753 Transcript_6645/m.5753 type:complete len:90 (+) Transcript_6645:61-330(+)